MIPVFAGMLVVLGALALIGFGLVLVIAGVMARRPGVTRAGGILAGMAMGTWGLAWVVGYLGSPSGVLPIGRELSFCTVDCHLHVSVVGVRKDRDLAVRLRFRNDARREPEYPFHLDIAVQDGSGRLQRPSSGMVAEPLGAGESVDRELRFAVSGDASPTLVVRYAGWLDYLIPGRGNALAQGRLRLGLSGGSSGVPGRPDAGPLRGSRSFPGAR